MGPGAEFVPYCLPGVAGLFCAVDGDRILRQDEALQTVATGNEMFANDVLDEFVQHCAVFGGLIPVALFLLVIPLSLLHFPCHPACHDGGIYFSYDDGIILWPGGYGMGILAFAGGGR